MLTVKQILTSKVKLDITCVDRVYLNGYVKHLQLAGGLVNFIMNTFNWPIPSPKAMYKISDDFRQSVKDYAQSEGLEIVTFQKGDDKDEIAKFHLQNFDKEQGVVLIGKAQEKANAYGSRREDKGKRVWFKYFRRTVHVTHFYFYILDKNFGLFFIKVCTYLPFEVKVCFNGHEWAKQQLRQQDIQFESLSNGFVWCESPIRLQAICNQLDATKIQALFDYWVKQMPWPLPQAQQEAGYQHQLSIWQMEVSRTQVFFDPEQGRSLIENIIRDNLDLGRPDRISLIFDRRITKATPSEFYTKVIREGVLPCIRIRYKNSALKQYYKDGRALRSEVAFNNTRDFGYSRSLKNFNALFDLGRKLNNNLLQQERISEDNYLPIDDIRNILQSTMTEDGQRASALHFGESRVMALLAAITKHAHTIFNFRNKNIRRSMVQLLGITDEEYSCAQMSYDLRRLRLKGLIVRIDKTHCYKLTELGAKLSVFLVKLYERIFRPGLSSMLTEQIFPSELADALNRMTEILEARFKGAFPAHQMLCA